MDILNGLKWIKRKFTNHNDVQSSSEDVSSASSDEEYALSEDEDFFSAEGLEDVSTVGGEYDDDSTDADSHMDFSEVVDDQQLPHVRVRDAPLTRSRSSSGTSMYMVPIVTQSNNQHYPTCNSCRSCLIMKYKTNPFTEVQILNADGTGHTDIIRQILPLCDEDDRDAFYRRNLPFLVASSCDDGGIIIWDLHSGRKHLSLNRHRLPVTCMAKIELENRRMLISGSCDKTVKMWDLEDGKCILTLAEHKGSVRCLALLEGEKFCSGGNDPEIYVWNYEGKQLGVIERNEDENLNAMIAINDCSICTASEKTSLHVYDTEKFCLKRILEGHNESVQCLIKVNDYFFASASSDGIILLWEISSLQAKRKLNEFIPLLITSDERKTAPPPSLRRVTSNLTQHSSVAGPKNSDKQQLSSISSKSFTNKIFHIKLTMINDKYLGVAIGKGFKAYDIETGECLLYQDDAHHANVNKLIPLHRGNLIVTCSDDSEIKIWNTHRQLRRYKNKSNTVTPQSATSPLSFISQHTNRRHSGKREHILSNTQTEASTPTQGANEMVKATLIGEMALHTDPVRDIVALSQHSFASCGTDKLILVWKDARMERRIRSFFACEHLLNQIHQAHVNASSTHSPRSSPRQKSIHKSLSQPNLTARKALAMEQDSTVIVE